VTVQEILSESGCFDCLSPGVKNTVMLGLLNSIEENTANPPAPPAPVGGATEALQLVGNASLASIDGKTPALVGGRVPVDGSGVTQPVSGTFWPATQPISASALPLPSGAATETTLASLLTEANFNSRIPTLGPALRAASIAVALPTDQTPVPASLPNAALTTYTQAGVIAINTILVTLDLLAYGGVAFQCTSMGTTGVVTAEWSIDNATWVTASINSQAGAVATTFSAAGLFNVVRQARYLRFRMSTATTAGTTTIQFERYVSLPCYWQATQPIAALIAGSAAIGDVGTQYRANATGAASGAHIVSAATTNATIVKNAAGRVVGWSLANTNAAWRYVKLHNQTTTPTAGTGVVRTIALAPNSVSNIHLDGGIAFTTGIGLTTVTGAADADATAVGLNDIVGDLYFA
jgi:hypothetical protein